MPWEPSDDGSSADAEANAPSVQPDTGLPKSSRKAQEAGKADSSEFYPGHSLFVKWGEPGSSSVFSTETSIVSATSAVDSPFDKDKKPLQTSSYGNVTAIADAALVGNFPAMSKRSHASSVTDSAESPKNAEDTDGRVPPHKFYFHGMADSPLMEWVHFDDATVQSLGKIESLPYTDSYMIFYTKRPNLLQRCINAEVWQAILAEQHLGTYAGAYADCLTYRDEALFTISSLIHKSFSAPAIFGSGNVPGFYASMDGRRCNRKLSGLWIYNLHHLPWPGPIFSEGLTPQRDCLTPSMLPPYIPISEKLWFILSLIYNGGEVSYGHSCNDHRGCASSVESYFAGSEVSQNAVKHEKTGLPANSARPKEHLLGIQSDVIHSSDFWGMRVNWAGCDPYGQPNFPVTDTRSAEEEVCRTWVQPQLEEAYRSAGGLSGGERSTKVHSASHPVSHFVSHAHRPSPDIPGARIAKADRNQPSYALSTNWIARWKAYLSGRGPRPAKLDNTDLFLPDLAKTATPPFVDATADTQSYQPLTLSTTVRGDLIRGRDYILLPERGWRDLKKFYRASKGDEVKFYLDEIALVMERSFEAMGQLQAKSTATGRGARTGGVHVTKSLDSLQQNSSLQRAGVFLSTAAPPEAGEETVGKGLRSKTSSQATSLPDGPETEGPSQEGSAPSEEQLDESSASPPATKRRGATTRASSARRRSTKTTKGTVARSRTVRGRPRTHTKR